MERFLSLLSRNLGSAFALTRIKIIENVMQREALSPLLVPEKMTGLRCSQVSSTKSLQSSQSWAAYAWKQSSLQFRPSESLQQTEMIFLPLVFRFMLLKKTLIFQILVFATVSHSTGIFFEFYSNIFFFSHIVK